MKNVYGAGLAIFLLALFLSSPLVLAAEENEVGISGIGLDDLFTIGSSILASMLFILTTLAYKRSGRKRLLYVSIAFLLFAIKGFLIASDIVFPEKGAWVDPSAKLLDFAILLSFFLGLLKK